jgi:hypothetical protein
MAVIVLRCRSWYAIDMPKRVVPNLSQEWLDKNYYRAGCNLRTAAERIGIEKRTLWAWLKANGYATKAQGEAQKGVLNGFYGRQHRQSSLHLIGAASQRRQASMRRGKFGRYGDDGKHESGPKHPAWKTGRSHYRSLVSLVACAYCGASGALQVHHRDKNRDNNALENLVVVCPRCHIFVVHGRKQDPRTGRFLKGGSRCNK